MGQYKSSLRIANSLIYFICEFAKVRTVYFLLQRECNWICISEWMYQLQINVNTSSFILCTENRSLLIYLNLHVRAHVATFNCSVHETVFTTLSNVLWAQIQFLCSNVFISRTNIPRVDAHSILASVFMPCYLAEEFPCGENIPAC